jgi:hypothetical protein
LSWFAGRVCREIGRAPSLRSMRGQRMMPSRCSLYPRGFALPVVLRFLRVLRGLWAVCACRRGSPIGRVGTVCPTRCPWVWVRLVARVWWCWVLSFPVLCCALARSMLTLLHARLSACCDLRCYRSTLCPQHGTTCSAMMPRPGARPYPGVTAFLAQRASR